MDSGLAAGGFYAFMLVVPFLLALLLPRQTRLVVLVSVGVACYLTVFLLNYRSSLVENGGDSAAGADTAALVGILNAFIFLPLWTLGAALGWKLRDSWDATRLRGRRERPRPNASPR